MGSVPRNDPVFDLWIAQVDELFVAHCGQDHTYCAGYHFDWAYWAGKSPELAFRNAIHYCEQEYQRHSSEALRLLQIVRGGICEPEREE